VCVRLALAFSYFVILINSQENYNGFFEAFDTFGHALTKDLTKLLTKYDGKKIIVYVKDEGSNLNIMTLALKSIISCDVLSLIGSF
jgi:hypothetical protein